MLRSLYAHFRSPIMSSKAPTNPLVVVLGATGTGKTQVRAAQ